MECPICCENQLTGSEAEWYPCPCGFQLCAFCFERIMQINGQCPYCRRKYDADAQERIGPQYRPASEKSAEAEPIPTPSVCALSKTMVQILGVPYKIFTPSLLKRNEYLGQYGKILRIACYSVDKNPFTKIAMYCRHPNSFRNPETQPPGYVYVEFSTEEEAKNCIFALAGTRVLDSPIAVCPALTEQCTEYLQGKQCNSANCMKLHQEIDPKQYYATFNINELETNEKVKPYLQIPKPQMYDYYPKRAFGMSVFPPPKLIPPKNNGNANLIVTSVGKNSDPTPLINLATYNGAIPMPSLPTQSFKSYERKSLMDLLGLDRK